MNSTINNTEVVDMDTLARLINERGVKAYVEMTGGGVATIYVGEADSEGFYPVAAGPGTYKHREYDASVGYWDEFCYGRDDEGRTPPIDVSGPQPLEDIADDIVEFFNEVQDGRALLKAECKICNYTTNSRITLELWNGYGDCPNCTEYDKADTVWWTSDGMVVRIVEDRETGDETRTTLEPKMCEHDKWEMCDFAGRIIEDEAKWYADGGYMRCSECGQVIHDRTREVVMIAKERVVLA